MPKTPATTTEYFQTPEGKQWRLAGHDGDVRYFVPAHLDPTKIPAWNWASEDYLNTELGTLATIQTTGQDAA